MRKLFTLTLLLTLALCINAENRKWDFTKWSETTVANLKAGEDWSDIEKANQTEPTEISKDNCFWEVTARGTADGVELTANGQPIAELQGLLYTNTNSRSLAIAVNYPATDIGTYNGPSYLWFGGSKLNYFVIPNVKPGATIKMGVESHRSSDARGVELYLGRGTSGTKLLGPDGSAVSVPKTYEDQTWVVPMDASDAKNDEGNYDIQIYNTNGCHLYYIEVIEETPAMEEGSVAYIYDSSYPDYSAEADIMNYYIISRDNGAFGSAVRLDHIDIAGGTCGVSLDSLLTYSVVAVSGAISADNAYATTTLKQAISYVPMVNLNANLYAAWGYGEAVQTESGTVTVAEDYKNHDLFKPADSSTPDYVQADGTLALFEEPVIGVKLAADGLFAEDDVLATVGEATAVHIHNAGRNQYIFMPYAYENMTYNEDNVGDILTNAIKVAFASKAAVPQTATPSITQSYKNLSTDVAISCATKGAVIYYTIDGTTPSEASTLYTEPFNISATGVAVQAIAYADGYNPSEVGSANIDIYTTSAAPTISVEAGEGQATVTITGNEEGAALYYNFSGDNTVSASTQYTQPIVLTHPTTIYAFAGEVTGKINSEAVAAEVKIDGKVIRTKELSHFNANATQWSLGESKTCYYTEGKKNGYAYYVLVDSTTVKDELGNDSVVYNYAPANVLTEVRPEGSDWAARTYGQGMLWENLSISSDIDDTNTTARYRGWTAFDQGASNNSVSMGNVQKSNGVNNDPYSAHIISTKPFKGPFDVVVYVANGSSSNQPRGTIRVNADTLNADGWAIVDTAWCAPTQRWIKKTIASYEGTDEVYVKLQAEFSSYLVMDIYILAEDETATGIANVNQGEAAEGQLISTAVYSLNGTRLAAPVKGINIVKMTYANGVTKTRKMVVK